MSLTDIMSNADLSTWPQAAMLIFFGVFLLVVIRVLALSDRVDMDRRAALVLEEDDQTATSCR
ncbi:MAG: hypothetical protein VYC34_12120 [Planctomycetota bacterium]|nr:hypothetical protein [Planctomycetota bacterium]